MKGIVFTEFMDMVESEFGYEMVDQIIEDSNLESNGIYTSVGTYDHSEIVSLLMNLSKQTKVEAGVLLKQFGGYLFNTFLKGYPHFFEESENSIDFLQSIDSYIHVEVLKLYPDAMLPSFTTEKQEDGSFEMTYHSERKMSALALGLIEKSIEHFKDPFYVSMEMLEEDGSIAKFTIKNK